MGNGYERLEHLRNEILEKRKVESTAIGWSCEQKVGICWRVKRRHETENIRAVAEVMMVRKRPRGRPRLGCTVRRNMKHHGEMWQ